MRAVKRILKGMEQSRIMRSKKPRFRTSGLAAQGCEARMYDAYELHGC